MIKLSLFYAFIDQGGDCTLKCREIRPICTGIITFMLKTDPCDFQILFCLAQKFFFQYGCLLIKSLSESGFKDEPLIFMIFSDLHEQKNQGYQENQCNQRFKSLS